MQDTEGAQRLGTLAGTIWIVAAGAIGFLAYAQARLGYQQLAIWNGIAALLSVVFAARLVLRAHRTALGGSILFAAVTAGWQSYQIATGATSDLFVISTGAAAIAGVLSLVAWTSAAPEREPRNCPYCAKPVMWDQTRCDGCSQPLPA